MVDIDFKSEWTCLCMELVSSIGKLHIPRENIYNREINKGYK